MRAPPMSHATSAFTPSVPPATPHAPDVVCPGALPAAGSAAHDLGGPAADVTDEVRRRPVRAASEQLGGRTGERQLRLFVTGHDVGLDAEPFAHAVDEHVP